jgi:metallo-beta-lactamase family protein
MSDSSSGRFQPPTVTFWGAAQTVTGSMHLLEGAGQRVLLDCGQYRGPRGEARHRNEHFPFDPASIDAVVLSHAHVDHCGNLPNLVRQGFDGPVYCTPATRDLVGIMLNDSARIQAEDAVVARVVGGGETAGAAPLFSRGDAGETVGRCVPVAYGEQVEVAPGVRLRLHDAGHILGSSVVSLVVEQGGRDYRVTFTGDLGRRGLPFLPEPSPVPAADLLISESTYGGRVHDPLDVMAGKLAAVVRETVARGGKILVPAFSLGRTQLVVHFLERWMHEGRLPAVPLWVDSPLGAKIADIYGRHAAALRSVNGPEVPAARYLYDRDEAEEVSLAPEPRVIVASGGMCEGGRIVQHLRHHVDDPRCTIVLVSYQAPQSLGRQLLEKRPTVRFHGRTWNKWASVVELNGFSGHADRDDFVTLLGTAAGVTGRVRLVHGEPAQSEALVGTLRGRGFREVAAAYRGECVAVA